MKKYKNDLIKRLKEENKKSLTETLKGLTTYYEEKKPYILEGRGVRNWGKKTTQEKRQIIRQAYADLFAEACQEIDRLASLEPLKSFSARVEWSRNYTWGFNPSARVWVNNSHYGEGRASGCGYDKLSASINTALSKEASDIIKGAIIRHYIATGEKLPYCVYLWARGLVLSFGGAGVSTLRNILEYCGLKNWLHADMKTSDYITAGAE